ncbi:CopD family copper resistance protein [Neisseriaceae bacterium B1]
MSTLYPYAHILHLFCAIAFVGGVIFEALILSAIHGKEVGRDARKEAERAIGRRAVRVMPFIVLGVFLSGLIMAHRYASVLAQPFANAFSIQLSLKILLAFSILCHFIIAVYKIRTQTLTRAWSKYIHRAVLAQMLCIVFLAKSMFYIH